MRMALVGVLVALGWGVVAGAAAAQQDLPVLRPGVPVLGEIMDGDPVVETETLRAGYTSAPTVGRRFRIEVDEPGTYRVELRSCFFDAYLVLRDEAGGVVAEDDDGLVGSQAQVEFEGRVGAPVVVEACALHEGQGDFEIAVARGAAVKLDPRVRQEQAIAEVRRCLEVVQRSLAPNSPELARSLDGMARSLLHAGELVEARTLYERALDIMQVVLGADHLDVAELLFSLARISSEMGDYSEARSLYERSLEIFEAGLGRDHRKVAVTLNNLALVLQAMGAYTEARPLHERAIAIFEARLGPNDRQVAVSLGNLAELLRCMCAYPEARPYYDRALTILEAKHGPDHPDVARSLNNLALMLSQSGALAEARPLLERALAIWEEHHPDSREVASCLANLGLLKRSMGAYDEARLALVRSLEIWRKRVDPSHPKLAMALNNLAVLLYSMGSYAEARPLLMQSLEIREARLGPGHPDVVQGLTDMALVEINLGHVSTAADMVDHANSGRAEHVRTFLVGVSEAELYRYLGRFQVQLQLSLSPALRQDRSAPTYASLLGWKGQLLRVARASRMALRERFTPEALAASERLQAIATALSRETRDIGLTSPQLNPAQLDSLIAERERLGRELAPHLAGLLPPEPEWPDLRSALPPKAALVDLFIHPVYEPAKREADTIVAKGRWTDPVVSAWITRAESREPLHVDLGPAADIEAAVRALRESLGTLRGQSVVPRELADREVMRLVWAPLAPHLEGIETVLVSPDGVLATLPLEILRGEDGRHLVEDRSFVYLTDPTDLVRLGERSASPSPALLAVGGVDYRRAEEDGAPAAPPADPGVLATATDLDPAHSLPRGGWTDVWESLDHTGGEARKILARHEQAFPSSSRQQLSGPQATEEALKDAVPEHEVLHIATHGYFNPEGLPSLDDAARRAAEAQRDDPLRFEESFTAAAERLEGYSPGVLSGLVCAGANANLQPPRDDGYLTAEEVGWLDLSGVDLVVLSACDTGLGRPQSGEGLLGLRRAFLTAGAKTVISSLWSVPDQETAELMDLFYRNLWQRGLGKHESLRAAQLEMIRRNRERFDGDARPASWGAFVVDGDWR